MQTGCVLQEANAEVLPCVVIWPGAFSQCSAQGPSAASTARVVFHRFQPSPGPRWSCGEAPALLPTPLCFLHTRLAVVCAAPGLQPSESSPGSKREETRIGCKSFGTCFYPCGTCSVSKGTQGTVQSLCY